jgi:hypothetical protein
LALPVGRCGLAGAKVLVELARDAGPRKIHPARRDLLVENNWHTSALPIDIIWLPFLDHPSSPF